MSEGYFLNFAEQVVKEWIHSLKFKRVHFYFFLHFYFVQCHPRSCLFTIFTFEVFKFLAGISENILKSILPKNS